MVGLALLRCTTEQLKDFCGKVCATALCWALQTKYILLFWVLIPAHRADPCHRGILQSTSCKGHTMTPKYIPSGASNDSPVLSSVRSPPYRITRRLYIEIKLHPEIALSLFLKTPIKRGPAAFRGWSLLRRSTPRDSSADSGLHAVHSGHLIGSILPCTWFILHWNIE